MIKEAKKKKILEKLPKTPGVYKMLDEDGKVIYVGKAKNLSKRIRQYFKEGYSHSSRTKKLIEKMTDINLISVDSDLEAVILESNLIKQLKPKYNVIMKDDKNFSYIKITKEQFPQIKIVRKIEKDGAKYIGPKTSNFRVRETLKLIRKLFPYRHCGLGIKQISEEKDKDNKMEITNKVIKYPCLAYYIKTCAAPCIGKVNIDNYQRIVKGVEDFLNGKVDNVIKKEYAKMKVLASKKEFEKAAKLRDQIKRIEKIIEKQKVESTGNEFQDIINYFLLGEEAYFNLFQIRNGKLIDQENFILKTNEIEELEKEEILESFMKQYYELTTNKPKEILIPHELNNKEAIGDFIGGIKITIPQKGKKNRLIEMCLNNAKIYAEKNKPKWQIKNQETINATIKLQKILKLKDKLKRIECYDISHFSGKETVGSMVVFEDGVPNKEMYRKFKLRTLNDKVDDYSSLKEVLERRFSKIKSDYKVQKYKLGKSKKSEYEFIEKHNNIDMKKTDRLLYSMRYEKEIKGFISTINYNEKICELSNLWILKEERGKKLGYKVLKDIIKKVKYKRIYVLSKEKIKNYYLIFGFEEIKKVPKELVERQKKLEQKHGKMSVLVYDKVKKKEDKSFSKIPDLVVIDGGKGQLSSAYEILKKLELKIPLISLAKKNEEIFKIGEKNSINLEKNNEALKLLQRARDEAHRFAITYNKKLRQKKLTNKKK